MDLFTLVGLLLGVFGATYTAIGALKGWFDPVIHRVREQASTGISSVRNLTNQPHAQQTVSTYNRVLTIFCWLYQLAQAVPIIAFSWFSFWLAWWSYDHWSELAKKTSEHFWQAILGYSVVIGLCCLALAVVAFVAVFVIGAVINAHCKTAMEKGTPTITAV
jgi:hypothetical protein